jgi:hypothetical protein
VASFEFPQVLRGVKSGARGQRCEQQFRGRHAFVKASVFGRLVAYDRVLACFDFELYGSEMFDCDFHDGPLPAGAEAPDSFRS